MHLEQIMSKCLLRSNPWDNLTKEEQDQLMFCIKKYKAWCDSWDNVRRSHERYNIPYNGPSVWLEDYILIAWERLSRKAWGVVK